MSEPEPEPIPEVLHSAYEEGPFSACISCGADLTEPSCMYQIQKAWRHGEVVFELAVCVGCAAETMKEFSQESLEKMQRFFQDRYRPAEEEGSCDFCGKSRGPDSEFEIGAACRGTFLLRPMVTVCGECTAASQEDLSQKTRDAWGRFVERNLPGVPESLSPDVVPITF
ncbi:MAG: hypothetical protein ACYTDY_20085 [Planctomycetota bacterium]|jgi:hypothetical protein